jgi:hypothetical protein
MWNVLIKKIHHFLEYLLVITQRNNDGVSFVRHDLSLFAIPVFIVFTFPIIFSHSELCHNLAHDVIILTDSAEVGRCADL